MFFKKMGYRGHIEITGGALVRGWCARLDGEPGRVSIYVDDQIRAEFLALNYRKDLEDRGFCRTGGGFEVDISSFLEPFAASRVRLTSPDGMVLPRGEFEVDYRDIIRGELAHLFKSENKTVGLYGNPYSAGDVTTGTVFSKIVYALGVKKVQSGASDCNIWHHHPHYPKPEVPRLLNGAFTDISKSGIDKAHLKVFGRALCLKPDEIDSEASYVIKAAANAAHDGRIVTGREVAFESGKVVQHLIDNRIGEDFVRDTRVPVIGNVIPFVYIKRRSIETRFSNANTAVSITATGNVLSPSEVGDILRFCREIGFDYGELDVLRDNRDQSIWIVDANNTPSGPPNGLARVEVAFAVRELALAFQSQFL
jgi:hypothetical protein